MNDEQQVEKIITDIVRVGMLRQWLNEDRITDHTKMITNEDIVYWLNPDYVADKQTEPLL